MDIFHRTKLLIGQARLDCLARSHVAVFGVGGVGSHAADALVRAGVGTLTLIDFDRIIPSNINRQLHAFTDTVGEIKVEAMADHCRRVNPGAVVHALATRFDAPTTEQLLAPPYDYVIDAIDSLGPKVYLIDQCVRRQIPLVASMGAASKMDPTKVRLGRLFETRHCPLARLVRKRLRKRGITEHVPVVYSEEMPILRPPDAEFSQEDRESRAFPNGTISYLPALFGLYCAAHVIQQLLTHLAFQRQGDYPGLPPLPTADQ